MLRRKTDRINITLRYRSDSEHSPPQPNIDLARAKYPVVNGNFTLLCTVRIEPNTTLHVEWMYPNKGSPRIIETNATMRERTNSNYYVYREVTRELIVTESKLNDTGIYTCVVTDHSGKHNSITTLIAVHAKNQTHFNFTTDFDISKPIVRIEGDQVKIVITVSAYPDLDQVQMYWTKDGKLLKNDTLQVYADLLQIKNTTTQVIFPITQLEMSDAGKYILFGRTTDLFKNITLQLLVEDAKHRIEVNASNHDPVDGDEVRLTCRGSILLYSKLLWSWKPNNEKELIPIADDNIQLSLIQLTTPYFHSVTIYFHPISTNYSGKFVCTAWNLNMDYHWEEELNVTVKAIEAPYIVETNMEGRTVDIEPLVEFQFVCDVEGIPKPTITWYKDEQPYDVSNLSGVELMNDNQSLSIKRVVDTDSGVYKCRAENRGGVKELYSTLNVIKDDLGGPPLTTRTLIAIICTVLGFSVIFVVVAVVLVKKIREERKEKQEMEQFRRALFNRGQIEMFNPHMALHDQVDLLPYDDRKWEFPKGRLKFGKTLGQGAFGRVVKADAIGIEVGRTTTIVAVKMLKERADRAQRKALMTELKILIHLGSHLNIVNILGAVTKDVAKGELMVIMEYCCHGNMRNYLLRHRSSFANQINIETGEIDPSIGKLLVSPVDEQGCPFTSTSDSGWSNPLYGLKVMNQSSGNYSGPTIDSEPTSPTTRKSFYATNTDDTVKGACCQLGKFIPHFVSTCDLMCYAFQCARGMEYLATRKLIHRDLAARNILLGEDKIVKICDFGLAKDCYKYSNYVKKGNGPLPIKWMAIESIGDKLFTTKSDVWSFGILLWEIFTLGGNPYPGIEIDENFYKRLKSGYRMEKPEYAPIDLYQIMTTCWETDPELRPSFTDLSDKIGQFLEAGVRKYYVELNSPYAEINSQLSSNDLPMSSTDGLNKTTEPTVDLQQQQDNKKVEDVPAAFQRSPSSRTYHTRL